MADFRQKLAASVSSNNTRSKDFEVINMQAKNNYGNMFFVPVSPSDGSDPIVVLDNVLEVLDHYKGKDRDGKDYSGKRWLKLLSKSEYPDLTDDEKSLYSELRTKAKTLMNHRFSKNDKKNNEIKSGLIRTKNYCLLMGYLLEHRDLNDKLIRRDKPVILVFSSNRFNDALNKSLLAKDKTTGGTEWQAKLFNRNPLRKMFLTISYKLSDDPKIIGYIASVSIEKFDDETVRLTEGKEDGLHMEGKDDLMNQFGPILPLWLNMKPNERLFKEDHISNFQNRLHKYLNRYCGTDYTVFDSNEVKVTEGNKDPEVKREKVSEELPPENDPKAKDALKDIWDK